ncbi:universal stress protein [Agrobacterium tumefaciens]|jgi:nucleotide-binding universal stress UspA family protein|uniref:universal stress protein n=1 Tax=Agrobacterium tumefaciens TaxID=358 RepID=UPI001574AF60|nr:universal stress protein [Agrobacterium tumefaciens]WCK68733.1 universal stress protein [Agrobacterium tumefaciens]
MSFKTILAIVGVSNAVTDLSNAISLVADTDAHLSILVVRAGLQPITADYPVATAWLEKRGKEIDELSDVRQQAGDLCRKAGISYDVDSLYDDLFILQSNIRLRAMYADLVVLGPGVRSDEGLRKTVINAVAFDAGAPIFLMPESGTITLAPQNLMLAWNSKPEAANAAKAALALLKGAENTHVVLVDPDSNYFKNGGEPGADIATFLARHGVTTTVEQLASGERRTEEVLRQHALELGCDMIVMGAYGHSRLLERIFGGVTASILEECQCPVFLAR